ncbi:MAG: YhdP family protein [Nitrosomonas sp.]|uniref:YhdP family protein n=1 Tax=Nitrosomonas sp. TaxID=42353 RepID=UPI002B36F668|nr:YhdP family protein [Nitrosomonas sp.]MEB2331333.1 YhdP family protein [Nitrosomonas sp.]
MPHSLLRHCTVCLGWAGRGFLLVAILACLLLLALRYWILPDIGKYRSDIAAAMTRVAGQPVRIDSIRANWDGLRPHLSMQGVSVSDRQDEPVLVFPEIEGTVSWRSLLRGELNFHEIIIDRPALVTRRDVKGVLHIAGVTLGENQQESGFLDWLLRQRRLIIRQAVIYWQDELHRRPVHYFESVNLHLQNKRGGRRHQFGLQAHSSDPLFSRVDLRGDVTGDSVRTLSAWQGRLFIQLQDVDLGSWQEWMTLPADLVLKKGKGSMRAWADIRAGILARWVSDISLRGTAVHVARQLPVLEIDRLHGRWGWHETEDAKGVNRQWFARGMSIELNGLPLTGPIDASWRVLNPKDGGLPIHSLQAGGLRMDVLTRLAASLPVEEALHESLSRLSARGMVKHVNLEWRGDWTKKPPFRINAGFSDLAVQSFDDYPAFSGISGIVDATEAGGSLFLSSKNVEISKSQSLGEKFRFDSLIGRVDWKTAADHAVTRIKFSDIAFESDAGSGTLQGNCAFDREMPARIDLTGGLSHADMHLLGEYATWMADETWKDKLDKATLSGKLSDAKFHLRGVLNGRSADKKGAFSIHAETAISNAGIKISDDWPEVSDMAGRVSIQDGALDLSLSSASVAGIRLQKFMLQSDDVYADRPEIRIKGMAEGESGEMATLLRRVDVGPHVGELLGQAEFSGKGRLQAEVALSVGQEKFSVTRMQGRYQFVDNRIDLDRYIPDFHQVNGSLIFTESGVVLEGIRAQVMGGAVEFSSASLPEGGVSITARGRADFDHFRPDANLVKRVDLSQLWTQFIRGGSAWQAAVEVESGKVGIVVESSLEGVELMFPAPFSKTAAEVIPVRLEKVFTLPRDDHVHFHYGDILTAEFQRIREKAHYYHPVRGIISFGGHGTLPQDRVTRVEGSVSRLEWDQLRELFKRHAGMDASLDHTARGLDNILTRSVQFDLHIGQFEFLSSYFNDTHFSIDRQGESWRVDVSSQEVDGRIDWQAASPQKVVARLSRLKIPEDAPENILTPYKHDPPGDWPAVDIEADELFVKGGLLGQMKLSAVQRQDGWLVENLDIRHPNSRLQANGLWENHKPPYRMYSHIRLQSSNIGKLFKRHGYPGRIARGKGVLEGNLDWAGKPFSVDFATLYGSLQLDAQHGQFTELKPGIGRLLGVFDLKSLPRRLTLNFYDVFGKGFGFDELNGHISIKSGVASVDDLYIAGSAAELILKGEWDLVNETQTLNLKVFPSFGLATPIAGIAAMIAKRALQDPFDRVLLNEYAITGSWSDPVVVRLDEERDKVEQP